MADEKFRTYEDCMGFLLEFTDYEKITKYKYDIATFDLERVEELMASVGSPHRAFRSVHVAGTKGKGSTASMVQSILTAAGCRTGLYTSPHLSRLEERMTIDGELMSAPELMDVINELVPHTRRMRAEAPNESPTFFELVTAAAFRHFARQRVDFAVVEVGLGGRLDATNVILPEVSVITRIDYDHVERLGDTLDKIAFEKAGIVKPGSPVVCAPQETEAMGRIEAVAAERDAPMTVVGRDYVLESIRTGASDEGPFCRFDLRGPRGAYADLSLSLFGEHQAGNAALAVAAIETLAERADVEADELAIRRGLAAARCPARQEFFPGRPSVLLDAAHNRISVAMLLKALDALAEGRRLVMVLGFSRDKDIPAMLQMLLPRADEAVFTCSDSPRAEEPAALAEMARDLCRFDGDATPDPEQALARARERAGPDGLVCVAGSFFLAGRLRPTLTHDGEGVRC